MTLGSTITSFLYLIISSTSKHLVCETLRADVKFAKFHPPAKETSIVPQS